MLAKRIIPCLDICNNKVVKGVKFRNHQIMDDIIPLARRYIKEGADELVFYDILASSNNQVVDKTWISQIAEFIDIPFCVAGGISSISQAQNILKYGADKISINSPALANPTLISELADRFGTQCIVIGIDSWYQKNNNIYLVNQYTGSAHCTITTNWEVVDWVLEVQRLGAGEIVLNMINQDGLCNGYNIQHLLQVREHCRVPLIASGGAGTSQHFLTVFREARVDGALAASVFHKKIINIKQLKNFLAQQGIEIRS